MGRLVLGLVFCGSVVSGFVVQLVHWSQGLLVCEMWDNDSLRACVREAVQWYVSPSVCDSVILSVLASVGLWVCGFIDLEVCGSVIFFKFFLCPCFCDS